VVTLLQRPIRFGVALRPASSPGEWRDKARLAEALGFDILYRSDIPGMPSPLPALVAAAVATERIRVGTSVLNVGFWHPRLLARELATVDQLTGGRLEIGLGSGDLQIATLDAPLSPTPPRERMARLIRAVEAIRAHADDPASNPKFVQSPHPPLLIAGVGDRLLRYAVANAATVNFGLAPNPPRPGQPPGPPLVDPATAEERTGFVRREADTLQRDVELSLPILQVVVTSDRRAAAEELQRTVASYLTVEEILDSPKALIGTIPEMAQQLRERRERYGFNHYLIPEQFMHDLSMVKALLAEEISVAAAGRR
jgi:probable F420-dependent oxidoreductase